MKSKNKKSNKILNIISKLIAIILAISFVVSIGLLVYFEILPILYLSLAIIIGGFIIFLLFKLLFNSRTKKGFKIILLIPSIILIAIFTFACFYSFGTIGFFSKIFDIGIRNDEYSVYVLKDSKYEKIKDLNDKIIGISKTESQDVIKKLSRKIEFDMAEYDDTTEALIALEEKEVDAVVALDSTIDLLKEDTKKYDFIKSLYNFTVSTKVKTIKSNVNVEKDNFVMYISGIDTSGKVDAKARSDVNILVAVNPKDKKILMVNTPRDYYVKLGKINSFDKLTHAGVYGVEESVSTLEKLYDINIDYYTRVNFTTFINIVDELDGVEVDVPVSFCEQTSSRDSEKQICLRKGLQTLNGEEALALTRTRHSLSGGDRSRIENQLLVLRAIIDKALSPQILVKYNSLLNRVSDSIVTNMDQKSVTKLIKKQIKNNTAWDFNTYTVTGTDGYASTYSTGSAEVYVMKQEEKSVYEAKVLLDKILETKKYEEKNKEN